jgi:hypothetical protein
MKCLWETRQGSMPVKVNFEQKISTKYFWYDWLPVETSLRWLAAWGCKKKD